MKRDRQTDRQTDRDREIEIDTDTDTNRQTDRQTDRQIEIDTDTDTDRQTDRQTETERQSNCMDLRALSATQGHLKIRLWGITHLSCTLTLNKQVVNWSWIIITL